METKQTPLKTVDHYFQIVKFPSGETNVRLQDSNNIPRTGDVIVAQCMNWQAVMHLIAADNILIRNQIFVRWYIPFKPFARQDRITGTTHANETELLNNLLSGIRERLLFLDVHSREALGNFPFHIQQRAPIDFYEPFREDYIRIIPDKGAAEKYHNSSDSIRCTKLRDPVNGKLSGFYVPVDDLAEKIYPELVLIDDICDGGGTFIGIAEQLQKLRDRKDWSVRVVLYVTHGLFTKGTDTLLKYFDQIVTTNSVYTGESTERITVLNVLSEEFLVSCGCI